LIQKKEVLALILDSGCLILEMQECLNFKGLNEGETLILEFLILEMQGAW